jgi:hypothetical protein
MSTPHPPQKKIKFCSKTYTQMANTKYKKEQHTWALANKLGSYN